MCVLNPFQIGCATVRFCVLLRLGNGLSVCVIRSIRSKNPLTALLPVVLSYALSTDSGNGLSGLGVQKSVPDRLCCGKILRFVMVEERIVRVCNPFNPLQKSVGSSLPVVLSCALPTDSGNGLSGLGERNPFQIGCAAVRFCVLLRLRNGLCVFRIRSIRSKNPLAARPIKSQTRPLPS